MRGLVLHCLLLDLVSHHEPMIKFFLLLKFHFLLKSEEMASCEVIDVAFRETMLAEFSD